MTSKKWKEKKKYFAQLVVSYANVCFKRQSVKQTVNNRTSIENSYKSNSSTH